MLDSRDADFIDALEYRPRALFRPNSFFVFLTSRAIAVITYALPRIFYFRNVGQILKNTLNANINFTPVCCPQHPNVVNISIVNIIKLFLFTWTKSVNKILKGKDERYKLFYNKYGNDRTVYKDPIKAKAHKLFLKYRKYKLKQRMARF